MLESSCPPHHLSSLSVGHVSLFSVLTLASSLPLNPSRPLSLLSLSPSLPTSLRKVIQTEVNVEHDARRQVHAFSELKHGVRPFPRLHPLAWHRMMGRTRSHKVAQGQPQNRNKWRLRQGSRKPVLETNPSVAEKRNTFFVGVPST